MINAIIPQDIGLQYLIFISTDIKKRMASHSITAKLKITVTTAAVSSPKWIAETEVAASINRTTTLPFIEET
jgi:hypothetical protein